jgi:hypothetical protein
MATTFKQIRQQFPAVRRILEMIYLDNGGRVAFNSLDFPVKDFDIKAYQRAEKIAAGLTAEQQETLATDTESLDVDAVTRQNIESSLQPLLTSFFDGDNSMFHR